MQKLKEEVINDNFAITIKMLYNRINLIKYKGIKIEF